jgi:hypothetical protein
VRASLPSLILFLSFFSASTVSAQVATRLTSASNVRLRAEAAETATVVSSLPLGTELVQLDTGGEDHAWLRVRPTTGPDGWVPARLTRRIKPETRLDVIESLVRERLARSGDSFAARVELVALIERTIAGLGEQPEPGGRFALAWLSALDSAAQAIPRSQSGAEPYASWIAGHRNVVFRNEIAGRWAIPRAAILDLHDRHRDTSAADDIAWFLVTNGLGVQGECEGFVPCYVRRMNEFEGTYLKRHPAGQHAGEAASRAADAATRYTQQGPRGYFFASPKDCVELMAAIEPIRAAVAATRADRREEALAALDRLRAPCK